MNLIAGNGHDPKGKLNAHTKGKKDKTQCNRIPIDEKKEESHAHNRSHKTPQNVSPNQGFFLSGYGISSCNAYFEIRSGSPDLVYFGH